MISMLSIFHGMALAFALAIAPLFWFLTFIHKKQYRNVEFEWKRTELNVFGILCFGINLALFMSACFFFAGYLKRIHLDVIKLSSESMGLLCFDCLLFFIGVSVTYMGLQNLFSQRICSQGIIIEQFSFKSLKGKKTYITWEEIKDYYIQPESSSSPLSRFQFIVKQTENTFGRKTLKVPFYALCQFETLLEMNLKRKKEERQQIKQEQKQISKNMQLEE